MSEAELKALKAEVASLKATLVALAPIILKIGDIAQAGQLDSEKGDPEVPFDPKAWRGESYKGKRFSEAPADLLDMLGDFFTWSANNPKEGKEQYAGSDRRKASLAYGWAYRKRTGGATAAPARTNGGARQGSGGAGGFGGGGGYGASNGGSRAAAGGYGSSGGGYGGGGGRAPAPPDDAGGGYGGDNMDDVPFGSCDIAHDLKRCGLL